jgi:hypothetical protein
MARYYSIITKEEFLKKIEYLMDTLQEEEIENDDEGYPYNLPSIISKDLSKVLFDWENHSCFDDEPRPNILEGYREIAPGFHVFFCWAGGDWEMPVTFIYYNSEKGIRGYIPTKGNLFNKKTKEAYGNDPDDNDICLDETVDEAKIIADILKRIVLKK